MRLSSSTSHASHAEAGAATGSTDAATFAKMQARRAHELASEPKTKLELEPTIRLVTPRPSTFKPLPQVTPLDVEPLVLKGIGYDLSPPARACWWGWDFVPEGVDRDEFEYVCLACFPFPSSCTLTVL